jgi:hypothetical protein
MKWTSEKTEEVVKNEQPRETSNIWHKTQKEDKKKSHYGFPPPPKTNTGANSGAHKG